MKTGNDVNDSTRKYVALAAASYSMLVGWASLQARWSANFLQCFCCCWPLFGPLLTGFST